ncbi:hypothetical protein C7999DRAFT_17325 [Corynascus novoguineensis]|uniref:Rab-GAP TBC domain-containing protein n=1 Tax=Corynascus novoguineensis TaxID=1126955 RepID=A0AAN7CNC8_9PEZI|nr:hypothetical protein C7999DRAFT_17325 [Corynascus novoguineensis]
MAIQKFSSVRHGRPPAAVRITPFRDDTGLVALRYEETKRAEPPIPLPPPRNPRRLARTSSTSTSTTASVSPIIINPPRVPPPQEEHPLFRAQRHLQQAQAQLQTHAEERKRDSGAPTSSTVTLREENAEGPVHPKIWNDVADTPSVYSNDGEEPPLVSPLVPLPLTVRIPSRPEKNPAAAVGSPSSFASPTSPTPSLSSSSSPRRASFTEKITNRVYKFGIGPNGSRRIRKRMLGADRAAAQATPSAQEPERGSPQSPKWPQSPNKLPPQAAVPGPSSTDRGHSKAPLSSATPPSANAKSSPPIITTPIPDDNLWEDLPAVSFSKRGSIMFGSKSKKNRFKSLIMSTPDAKAHAPPPSGTTADDEHATASPAEALQPRTINANATTTPETLAAKVDEITMRDVSADAPSVPSIRVSSMDVERESQKVRSLYESGDDLNWEDGGRVSYSERLEPTAEVPSEEEENVVPVASSDPPSASDLPQDDRPNPTATTTTPASANSLSPPRDDQVRREYERAGGIEDWADLDGVEVDRYGFITPKRPVSSAGTAVPRSSPFSSRRRNVLTKRPSTSYSTSLPGGFIRPPSRKVSARSLNTYASDLSTVSRRSTRSSIRSATNRLPHNRDRRWMDEAGEMLSLQAGLTGITDDEKMGKMVEAQKRKEAERSEKWRKMAIAVKPSITTIATTNTTSADADPNHPTQALPRLATQFPQGQGMSYTFDTTSPKLIDRVWKGIPDCWRSAAWWAFLSTSAASHDHNYSSKTPRETEDYLIGEFRRLQAVASPDDVQIDLDVPRTVNGHIMFRRRYRGGQRLLFRVLHAISLYFPGTGYVQGMASLAATLLCYFDEERAFVMLVRLWRYRGLERLYQPGFAGLMSALAEFESKWLTGAGKDVAEKLKELTIDATAYGTRWYLTLFNLSIPFPAQLRVWDVFMLLGDCAPEPAVTANATSMVSPNVTIATATDDGPPPQNQDETPPKGLDILHATAAALIHALRDVLIDSDFENAMKALTAWIPVRDEDLLMKVARAEWRRHQHGRGVRLWEWEWERVHKGKEVKDREGGKEKTEQQINVVDKAKDKEKKDKTKGLGKSMGKLWERGSERDKGKDKQQQQQQQQQHEQPNGGRGEKDTTV